MTGAGAAYERYLWEQQKAAENRETSSRGNAAFEARHKSQMDALAADIASRQSNSGAAVSEQQPDPVAEHAELERKVTASRDQMFRALHMRIPAEPVRLPYTPPAAPSSPEAA